MQNLLISFYGDDFTGSTDAMEALHRFGLRTILFLDVPNEELLQEFQGVQCIGIAGTARAKKKNGIEKELKPVWELFQKLQPQIIHYKICSTFDSSPEIGSIGFVSDLAREYFSGSFPVLVATPDLGRFTIFGDHFAQFQDNVYRLDRHPVMSKHPVTPMNEANLAQHLQQQTKQSIGNVTVLDMENDNNSSLRSLKEDDITIFDALENKHMQYFAEHLLNQTEYPQFVIGSSGVEYALAEQWQHETKQTASNEIQIQEPDQMLIISGSVSAVTEQQLNEAEASGFHMIQVPPRLFLENKLPVDFLDEVLHSMAQKSKVILYSARGVNDDSITRTKDLLTNSGIKADDIGIHIGKKLGEWTKYLMDQSDTKRLVVSGGDTSGFVTSQLSIYGLEVLTSIAPGAPLCHAYSEDERFNGIEVALKSGQLGGQYFFENVFLAGNNTHINH